jgi:tyrosine-protein phosphatase YwqE
MFERIVFFMRGFYSTGKSTRAKELAGDTGIVLEEDKYFEVSTGNDTEYIYREWDIPKARKYVYRELKRAMRQGINPIVIDRDNHPSNYTKKLMKRVVESGYTPKLAEPTSELWKIYKRMLKNKKFVSNKSLVEFTQKLFILNQKTHGVPFDKIFHRVTHWPGDATIDDFLNYKESASDKPKFQLTVNLDSE